MSTTETVFVCKTRSKLFSKLRVFVCKGVHQVGKRIIRTHRHSFRQDRKKFEKVSKMVAVSAVEELPALAFFRSALILS